MMIHHKIAVSGSTGLIGEELVRFFKAQGSQVSRIIRPQTQQTFKEKTISWDVERDDIDLRALDGHDVVIHLAGASIADKRWTPAYKEILTQSRIRSTRLLASAVSQLRHPPKVFLSASAVGYYGARDSHFSVDEMATPGADFLARLCVDWERMLETAERSGIRVVKMRFGVILSKKGGALAKMLPPFQMGAGGPIGSGDQIMSWIALEEIPAMVQHVIEKQNISGPINFVSNQPVSNKEFAETLGKVLHRPAFMPLPAFAARAMFGEMADSLLLNGARVMPRRLMETGYHFRYPTLEEGLKVALSKYQ